MSKVSERFILEHEVRDSIFFLSLIPCVVCVKCGSFLFVVQSICIILSFI